MFRMLNFGSKPDHLATAKQKLRDLVALHLKTLAIQRHAGISEDAYSNVDGSKWNAEAQYFVDKLFSPRLSNEEKQAVKNAGLSIIVQQLIEKPVRDECGRMHAAGEHDMTVRQFHPPDQKAKRTAAPRLGMPLATGLAPAAITRGLIIREEPLDRILSGMKTWEMRTGHTKIRGTVALIRKGSKAIFGVADIVDSRGPFSRAEMLESVRCHGIVPDRLDNSDVTDYRFAWVLQKVRRLPRQIRYQHKGGVIFVTLDMLAASELAQSVDQMKAGA